MEPSDDRRELARLKRQQERLQDELFALGGRLRELEQRVSEPDGAGDRPEPDVEGLKPDESAEVESAQVPPPIPPRPRQLEPVASEDDEGPGEPLASAPEPLIPAPWEKGVESAARVEDELDEGRSALEKDPVNAGDWELKLGRVWFVRIGVGLLLTGLVFLSLYAYQNWVFGASAGVKVSFFFASSLAMVAGGYLLERRRESLRQYGQVLSAGGLAAAYYTLYAAHFVPALKLIGSPVVAGILLCLWAGIMLIYSAWRQGSVLAVMSIGLAFYATVVNPSGWISLFSSLVLSVSAMLLLLRYRWVWVGAAGVVAAYLSHAFWLGLMGAGTAETLRVVYLGCYWLLFATSLLVPQAREVGVRCRSGLLSLNNTAFWALLVFQIPSLHPHEQIGWISIGVGVAWMLLAGVMGWKGGWRREYAVLWGYQGLLVATLGLMIEASGYSRFLMLAAEACVLLVGVRWFGPKWSRVAALLCYLASVAFALLEGMAWLGEVPAWPGYLGAAAFGFAFIGLLRRDIDGCDEKELVSVFGRRHEAIPLWLAVLPWAVLMLGCLVRWETGWAVMGVFAFPALFAGLRQLSGRREFLDATLITPFALAGGLIWLLGEVSTIPGWAFAAAVLALAVYWLLAPRVRDAFSEIDDYAGAANSSWIEWLAALGLGLVACRWYGSPLDNPSVWVLAGPATALAGTVAFPFTRRFSLAVILGLFHLGALIATWDPQCAAPAWQVAVPGALLLLHLGLAEFQFGAKVMKAARPVAGALLALMFSGLVYLRDWPQPELWLGALGAAWMAFSFYRRDAPAALAGGWFPILAASILTLTLREPIAWSPYLILALLPLASLLVKRVIPSPPSAAWTGFRQIAGLAGLLLLGVKLSMHVLESFAGSGLAICWGLYAVLLFAAGLFAADSLFRRFGLFYLAIVLVHILAVDVMKLDTLGRILSFLTLGLVLLLLGFLYNRFHEKIRKYL